MMLQSLSLARFARRTRRSSRVPALPAGGWLLVYLATLPAAACTSGSNGPGARGARDPQSGSGAQAGGGQSGSAGITSQYPPTAGKYSTGDDAGASVGDTLVITPGASTLNLDTTAPKPVTFSARLDNGQASAIDVQWRVDRRELGTIDAKTGVFTPSGAAGSVKITARAGSLTTVLSLELVVKLAQEGDPDADGMPAGAGGLGGVGGEGGGSAITAMPLRAALDAAGSDDAELKWLYPYDETVWPRGLPAPLLQWQHGAHAPVAVKLHISVAPSFTADIYLGAPKALAAGTAIDRLPIPQAIWRNALQSGDTMKVSLTVAADDGAGGYATYKATQEQTWHVAPTTLKGTVYYNSYGTKLAENYGGARGGNGRFGGATLAIQRDSFDPTLVAGSTSQDDSGCRVCHTVSANGGLLMVQQPNYTSTSAYDLRNMNQETKLPASNDAKFGWAGLSPDGTLAIGSSGPPGAGTQGPSSLAKTELYKTSDGTVLTSNGLGTFVTQAAMPMFSPDMSKLVFNLYAGAGNAEIKADTRSLVVMDVKKVDDTTYDFSNPKAVFTATGSNQLPGWGFFLPDLSGVVFQLELAPGSGNEHFGTRSGARGELWWTDLGGHSHALDRANGKGVLPVAGMGHDVDTTLQYEPTVAPIVAGGYAWVVFTSRRLYGNVATRNPFESDPRGADLTPGNSQGPTTKKLWVTAISIPAKADSDPSHPAFYLPAQELYAGNSRGFWVLDACKEDNASCTAGDECCGGFCRIDPEFGKGVCSDVPPNTCSQEFDKCNVMSDCCDDGPEQLYCIAGRCAVMGGVD